MDQFEYVIPFIGIIYGLSITTLLSNVHRVLSQRQAIKLHPIPLIWTVACCVLIVNGWWGFFQVNHHLEIDNAGKLFMLCLIPMTAYLFCATILPQKDSRYANDLLGHFQSNKRLFLSLNAIYLLLISATLTALKQEFELNQGLISNLTMASVFIIAGFIRQVWLHYAVSILFTLLMASSLFSQLIVR